MPRRARTLTHLTAYGKPQEVTGLNDDSLECGNEIDRWGNLVSLPRARAVTAQ